MSPARWWLRGLVPLVTALCLAFVNLAYAFGCIGDNATPKMLRFCVAYGDTRGYTDGVLSGAVIAVILYAAVLAPVDWVTHAQRIKVVATVCLWIAAAVQAAVLVVTSP